MPAILNNIFKYIIPGLMFFLLGSLITKHQGELAYLKDISATQFSLIIFLVICSILTNGKKLSALAGSFDIKLNQWELLGLSSITTSLNNFFFKAGSLFTSHYLKQRYEFAFSSFVGSQGADHLISFFVHAIFGLVFSTFFLASENLVFLCITLGYLAITIFIGLIFYKNLDLRNRSNKYLNALIRAVNYLYGILKNKKLFYKLSIFNILIVLLNTFRFFLVCKVLGLEIPLLYCLLFITLLPFISATPIIQSDIGFRELIIGIFSETLGVGFETGMLATLLDRCFILLTSIIISFFFKKLWVGFKISEAANP